MNEPMLSARAVTKSYAMGKRSLEVLCGVNLDVARGEFLALRGASGAGKSTLLHLIGGLDSPNSGDIYFAGDTGYGPFAAHIRKKYPNGFRLAFLPIGAFRPPRMMRKFHMSPTDAVRLYKDLNVRRAVPIHFGTFQLALDRQDEAPETLQRILAEPKNSDVHFDILLNGQVLKIE